MIGTFTSQALGTWGKPPDMVAWAALGAAGAFLLIAIAPRSVQHFLGFEAHPDRDQRRRFISGCAFAAAFLSLGYVAFYLRGGPRIIDATSYFLEGHAIAHGRFSWHLPGPTASFRGRFLLFHDPDKLAVIFPPGFPLLLAAGFLVGAPMVIGPLIAGALVGATYLLTDELCRSDGGAPADDRLRIHGASAATLAAVFSIASAAMRYHTADTMAHAASALGVTIALTCALRARRTDSLMHFALAGLALGWIVSTRPVSALPITIAVFGVGAFRARSATPLLATVLGMVPGLALLSLAQRAATGSAWISPQELYYATSDGPPGCFRYGFGRGIGCVMEHGDFVKAHLSSGYGLAAAIATTGRRLKAHLLDVLNLEPLCLFVLWPLLGRLRTRGGLALAVVLGQVLAYAPFYFDGNYPGGGARLYADVLPLEHALLAMGVALFLPRIAFVRRGLTILALACAGFAVHAVFEHEALADRDGGKPMYEPDVTRDYQVSQGVVFFDTDHGYNLALSPGADPTKDILAARMRGDDHDRLLLERLNNPQSHAYHFSADGSSLTPWVPAGGSQDFWRFEAEADWPPISQKNGWAEPAWFSGTCASAERALTLHPSEQGEASVTIDLPVAREGRWLITPRIVRTGSHGRGTLRLVPQRKTPVPDDDRLVWEWDDPELPMLAGPHETCVELVPREAALAEDGAEAGARWVMTATGGSVTLDRTTLKLLH